MGTEWAGLLITGNAAVDAAHLVESYNVVVSEAVDPNLLRPWVDAARGGGAQVWMQLNHPGSQALRAVARRSLARLDRPLLHQGRDPRRTTTLMQDSGTQRSEN
jgi:2,4-dienoyl-CoA reductase-like NADH-dependent reductase (Old Yellow Enzyme family)